MNGPIQPASNAAQIRASTSMINGGPLRRSLTSKSPSPIRIGFGTNQPVPQPSPQALLRRQAQSFVPLQRQSLFSPPSHSSTAVGQQQQPIETAFKVYEDRLQTDLRHFRTICSRLISQEQEEKEKWHALCLKMMKERDTARQRVSALISEREMNHHLSSPSAIPASAKENHTSSSKASKRARDDTTTSAAQESTQELPSQSTPVEPRPTRSLRLSPIPSPPGTPSASLYNSSMFVYPSSPLPSTSSPRSPSTHAAAAPLTSTKRLSSSPPSSSVTPPNIMTFNPTRSPNDKTCFDVYGVIDIPEPRPLKRRKSNENTIQPTAEDGETKSDSAYTPCSRNEKQKMRNDAEPPAPRPFLIAHTDIMYMPMKGRLFCRACL